MVFLLALKWNLCELGFSCVKTKTNSHFAVKFFERSSHLFSVSMKTHVIQKTSVIQWNCKTLIVYVNTNQKQPRLYLITNFYILNCSCSFSMWGSLKRLIVNWQERDSNPQSLFSETKTQSFSQTVWLNGCVFVYEPSNCMFESRCSHFIFWYCACFEQGVPWHSRNYRV